MKKLIFVTGLVLLSYVALSAMITPAAEVPSFETESVIRQTEDDGTVYTVVSENGRVTVLLNGVRYLSTDTLVSSLPKADQTRLEEGIVLTDRDDLKKLLEDYCS